MLSGLFGLTFRTPLGAGTGVVYLKDGHAHGSDSMMYYTGSYTQDGDNFKAEITTRRHASVPGMHSVFGENSSSITLRGEVSGNTGSLTGVSHGAPAVTLQAKINKLSD